MSPVDQAVLNRMADAGCTLADLDAVSIALERGRVVAVLDGWDADWGTKQQTMGEGVVFTCYLARGGKTFTGPTPDAARAAAARAIEAGGV